MLNRESILAVDDLTIESVAIPEWGGDVHVRTLTAGERDRFEAWTQADKFDRFRAKLAVLCVCDEQGQRIFGDDDVDAIAGKSTKPLDRITDVAFRLNRFTAADLESIKGN
jgi:hypothetical protein